MERGVDSLRIAVIEQGEFNEFFPYHMVRAVDAAHGDGDVVFFQSDS